MTDPRTGILCCIEHERLEFELLEVRARGQYLGWLRRLSRAEQADWDRREQAGADAAGRPRPGAWVQPLKACGSGSALALFAPIRR